MRKVQKFGAAVVVAAMMASGITIFSAPVHASGVSAAQKSYLCAQIDKAEAQLAASTNPFVVKYLKAILAYLQGLENLLGGCPGS
jgi:hypothetical protein